jgi:hypothetical protein
VATPLAYFTRVDEDLFDATAYTMGPWNPQHQHGGPPSALTACFMDAAHPREGFQVVRTTIELLGPVPIARLRASSELVRTGRSVEYLTGSLYDVDAGREVIRATMWRIRQLDADSSGLETVPVDYKLPQGPDGLEAGYGYPPGVIPDEAYLSSVEMRFAFGAFNKQGPAAAWARSKVTLIEGEPMPPLARVLALADSGNGISSVLGIGKWMYINPDLTVTLRRMPEGEWLCLDAQTGIEPVGIGLAESVLSDTRGPIGRGLQTLLVGTR